MARVFLSYDRDDANRARQFAHLLEKDGHEVWWDTNVRGGAQFSKAIEEALAASDAVVVLWSKDSIESAWVRDEASAGRDAGRMVPVTIDGTEPPIGFRQFQAIDLSRWKGHGRPPQLEMFLADVRSVAEGEKTAAKIEKSRSRPRHGTWNWTVGVAAAIAGVAVLVVWSPWNRSRSLPTVSVTAAADHPASRALADELAVELGTLSATQSAPVQLIEADARRGRADLELRVAPTNSGNAAGANLVLTRKDGTLLWSQDFSDQSGSVADLKQQLAYTAARVLGCVGEALNPQQPRTDQAMLKLYLNSCAQFAELDSTNVGSLITDLRTVVEEAPHFAGAWKKLLLAEAQVVDDARLDGTANLAAERALRNDIATARKLDPQMAEATLAEVSLTSVNDLVKRMELEDRAKQSSPDNPVVLRDRADMLRSVGRMGDALDDAQRAVKLDPLSPTMHASYLYSLAFTGQIDGARQELQQIKRLWPGSSTAQDMDFEFNLRFGDPAKALPYSQSRGLKGLTLFLEARSDPTKVDSYVSWLLNRKDVDVGRLGVMIQGLATFHREQDLYRVLLSWPQQTQFAAMGDIWFRPALHEFRRDPRFIRFASRTPLLRYWRTTGNWPDFCYEPGLPYDCKKAAAKLVGGVPI